jgi:hypothetical protein
LEGGGIKIMGATCKECGAVFATQPPSGCPYCSNAEVAIEEDNVLSSPSGAKDEEYIYTMLRHLLEDLCAKIYDGPASVEFRNTEIEQTIERMKPYLRNEPVKV